MQRIVLVGNAITAEILYQYLLLDDRYEVIAFAVEKDYLNDKTRFDLPVVDFAELRDFYPPDACHLLMGIGYNNLNQTRERLFLCGKEMGYKVEIYIHPDAKVFNKGNIGEGSIVLANTVVEVYTELGENSVVWANCVIGHHSRVGSHCWVGSGTVLAGQAVVGNNSFLGVNVTVSNQVKIGTSNVIGCNTAIHKSTKDNEVYLSPQGEKHRFSSEDYMKHFLL